MRSFLSSMLFSVLFLAVGMGLSAGQTYTSADAAEDMDIIETATAAGSFNTLVAAVNAAGLTETLKGEGPFTVFAPTDEAFAKLPAGTLEMLLKPENKDKLVAILSYHVVAGKVTSEEIVKLTSADSLSGKKIVIKASDGKVMVDGATVIKADVMANNGVIHVIDTVMMPPAD